MWFPPNQLDSEGLSRRPGGLTSLVPGRAGGRNPIPSLHQNGWRICQLLPGKSDVGGICVCTVRFVHQKLTFRVGLREVCAWKIYHERVEIGG